MRILLCMCFGLCSSTTLLAQSSAPSKMATGLSITLIILLGLVIYMTVKNQKLQRENKALKSELQQQNQ